MKYVLTYSLAYSGEQNYKLTCKHICSITCIIVSRNTGNSYEVAISVYFGWRGLEKQQGGPPHLSYRRGPLRILDSTTNYCTSQINHVINLNKIRFFTSGACYCSDSC